MIKVIEKIVCNGENVSPEEIHVKSREAELKEPRQIIMYLARKYTNMSQRLVGVYFEGLDHATVCNAENRIKGFIDTSRIFREKIEGYQKRIDNFREEFAKVEPDIVNLAILKTDVAELELKLTEKKAILIELLNKMNSGKTN